jgi:TonB-linked SusC/RagA family outer membrane protein
MTRALQKPKNCILLVAVVMWSLPGRSQTIIDRQSIAASPAVLTDQAPRHTTEAYRLVTILNALETRYHVSFHYNYNQIEGLYVTNPPDIGSNEKLKHVLQKVLVPLSLKFERVNDTIFLIKGKSDDRKVGGIRNLRSQEGFDIGADENHTALMPDRLYVLSPIPIQQRVITGQITAEDASNGLPGVSVVVKGTTTGTVSDAGGRYSIGIPSDNATLIFSYLGYETQEVKIDSRSVVDIVMAADITSLDEVVVIGYGTKKKSNLTAAVETVDMQALENRPIISVSEMLQGSVANLNIGVSSSAPGKTPTLNIRGFTGRNTLDGPLIIVDGVPQSIDYLNPNNIESISVLKDAAAAAIYGSRAPNGAIIITTKSGKKRMPISFSYSSLFRVSSPLNMPSSLNAYDFALLNNESGYNSQANPEYPEETIQRIRSFMDGEITDNNIIENGKWGFAFSSNANEDYYDIAFRDNVVNHSHNFSMQGGGDQVSYYAGVGYQKDQGVYNSDIDQHQTKNVVLKVDADVNKWLKLGINTRYAHHETARPNVRGGGDNDVSFLDNMAFRPNIPNINRVGGLTSINEFSILPSLTGAGGKVDRLRDDLLTTFSGTLNPVEGLSIRGSYSFNLDVYSEQRTSLKYYVTEPDGSITQSRRSISQEALQKWRDNNTYQTADLVATYTKAFGKHDLTTMVGYQHETSEYDNLNARNTDFYTTSVPSFSTMYGENQVIDDVLYSWATQGYFARMSYSYAGKYLFDFNSRYDASSRYSQETRWAFFPSVSVGYNVAMENFWPFKNKVNMFKIRGSWGQLGDAGTGRPRYVAPLSTGAQISQVLGGSRPAYVSMPEIVSADLTWTKPRTIGVGLELGALDNRLLFSYDWYQRTIFDEVGVAEQLPETLGTAVPPRNNAVSETRGWEASAEWRDEAFNVGGESISYGLRFIISDYIGYIVKYPGNPEGLRNLWTPGQQFGMVYGYESAGIQTSATDLQNKVLPSNAWFYPGDLLLNDRDGNGQINSGEGNFWYSEGDRVELGFDYPRYKYSIVLNAAWKRFSARVLLDGVGHQVLYALNKYTLGSIAIGSRGLLDFQGALGYWNSDNQDAFFPRIYNNPKTYNLANDQYLIDLSHLRIKNINVGYSLPMNTVKGIDGLTFSLSAENLGMIYYKSWAPLDPLFLSTRTYPPSRIFAAGLTVNLK